MKYALTVSLILAVSGIALANAGGITNANKAAQRVADASNACLINCASENESCKRVCPTAYNVPCLSACDNQAQFCRQACQNK
jgi:hypothetical protein